MNNYCLICNKEFTNLDNHLKKYHKLIPEEKNNKGNILCPLCKVRVGSLYKHYFSALHRHNILKKSVYIESTLDDFIRHFDRINSNKSVNKILNDEEDAFWITAKEELDEKDLKKLKEYIFGRKRTDSKHRNIRCRRFSRTS